MKKIFLFLILPITGIVALYFLITKNNASSPVSAGVGAGGGGILQTLLQQVPSGYGGVAAKAANSFSLGLGNLLDSAKNALTGTSSTTSNSNSSSITQSNTDLGTDPSVASDNAVSESLNSDEGQNAENGFDQNNTPDFTTGGYQDYQQTTTPEPQQTDDSTD